MLASPDSTCKLTPGARRGPQSQVRSPYADACGEWLRLHPGHGCAEEEPARGDGNAGHCRSGYNLPMKLEALMLKFIVRSVTIRSTGTL
jgi:hypothetical protein